jgi:protein involved in polysaccharide export with SLBB domain
MRLADRAWRYATASALALVSLVVATGVASAQDDDSYILGVDNRLQMKVHILGEVKNPGEYPVADDTNILELLSKAGGPTEFANLGSVVLTRVETTPAYLRAEGEGPRERVVKVNLDDYLKKSRPQALPVLLPGDVVTVPRNNMHKWRTFFGMTRDIAVVASAYFLYVRTFQNNNN